MIVTATRETQDALGGSRFSNLTSPSLRLEKFVRLGHANKKNEIDAVVACHNHRRDTFPALFAPASIPGVVTLHMKLQYRLIVNQAGGVLENAGICLHRHFGFPYIPGSAVKGAARHAAWLRWKNNNDPEQGLRLALTFGYPTGNRELDGALAAARPELFKEKSRFSTFGGTIAFFPAWPAAPEAVRLVTDIVNCHHPDYYAGKKDRATDDESPNPQFFPAVEKGAVFCFTLLPIPHRTSPIAKEFGFDPLEFAEQALREACEIHGLGAKTAAGYGWFELDRDAQERIEQERQKREREAAEQERLAKMTPEERAAEQYAAQHLENSGDPEGVLKGKMRQIATLPEDEQQHICLLLQGKFAKIWTADVRQADKVAGNEKKRKKDKAFARVQAVREVAAKLGIDLP